MLLLVGCDANLSGVPFFGPPDSKPAQELFVRATQRDMDAYETLISAASKGDTPSAFYAALINDPGYVRGSSGDLNKAIELYELASKKFTGATHNLALLLLKLDDPKEGARAIELLEQSAAKGRLESMLLAATLLDNGWRGIPKNPAKAVDWYEKAVTTYKDPRAELQLGKAYQDGYGRDQDGAKAQMYLQAGAKDGMIEAQYRMAALADSESVAAQWLVIAALNDPKYNNDATAALTQFNTRQQFNIRRNAEMWLHAHGSATKQISLLTSFTAPVEVP